MPITQWYWLSACIFFIVLNILLSNYLHVLVTRNLILPCFCLKPEASLRTVFFYGLYLLHFLVISLPNIYRHVLSSTADAILIHLSCTRFVYSHILCCWEANFFFSSSRGYIHALMCFHIIYIFVIYLFTKDEYTFVWDLSMLIYGLIHLQYHLVLIALYDLIVSGSGSCTAFIYNSIMSNSLVHLISFLLILLFFY